eukprot:TRINITY_DN72955_c0_g3_i1.p1 TRINITY_DN72955_c0_g3~~TRINITY_DN72955_c0_g3_i1.p1  ORF type:complete len:201 (-),score=51.28 TRINITY_DN72955_c0_g3_i1:303-866(-)
MRPLCRLHRTDRVQPQPRRQARTGVDDVGAHFGEQATQGRQMAQRQQRLAADIQGQVLGTAVEQRLHQATTSGHHQRAMAGSDQGRGDFKGRALDTAGVQRRQQLHHGQSAHRGGSRLVGQHEHGATVSTLRLPVGFVFDRQVHPRMRVPQRHFRGRAAQRQIAAVHGVALFGVGGRGGGMAHGGCR